MSGPIHCHTRSFSGAFGSTLGTSSLKSYLSDCTLIPSVKFSSLEYTSRQKLTVCSSNTENNYRRKNFDFSRQNGRGFSRHRNRGDYEDLEESETLMSNNGPSPSSFRKKKSQATSTPGSREREIVELFRKVQTQLRDRAATCEEKKVDSSPGKKKESKAVDSLLNLLRRHSVQKGKKNPSNARDNQEMKGSSTERSRTSIAEPSLQEGSKSHLPPKSSFRRRSAVPENKLLSEYTDDGRRKGISLELKGDDTDEVKAESEEEEPLFSKGKVFNEMPGDDVNPESYESKSDEHEPNQIEARNLSGMKVIELRALAKTRGIKGLSKLKKNELIELLSSSSNSCIRFS